MHCRDIEEWLELWVADYGCRRQPDLWLLLVLGWSPHVAASIMLMSLLTTGSWPSISFKISNVNIPVASLEAKDNQRCRRLRWHTLSPLVTACKTLLQGISSKWHRRTSVQIMMSSLLQIWTSLLPQINKSLLQQIIHRCNCWSVGTWMLLLQEKTTFTLFL